MIARCALAALLLGCAGPPALREFPDRPPALEELDDGDVPHPLRASP